MAHHDVPKLKARVRFLCTQIIKNHTQDVGWAFSGLKNCRFCHTRAEKGHAEDCVVLEAQELLKQLELV